MLFLPYEATCYELMDFGFNSVHNVRAKLALLLNWLGIWLDVQTMHGYLWIKSGYILVVPCEDINILSYEYYNSSLSISDMLSLI